MAALEQRDEVLWAALSPSEQVLDVRLRRYWRRRRAARRISALLLLLALSAVLLYAGSR